MPTLAYSIVSAQLRRCLCRNLPGVISAYGRTKSPAPRSLPILLDSASSSDLHLHDAGTCTSLGSATADTHLIKISVSVRNYRRKATLTDPAVVPRGGQRFSYLSLVDRDDPGPRRGGCDRRIIPGEHGGRGVRVASLTALVTTQSSGTGTDTNARAEYQ
jgi:hypothetical protein